MSSYTKPEKILYVANRQEWRAWLEENFDKEKEIWMVYPSKSSGKARVSYNDAVEEALCFGWIDSTAKSLDKDSSAQRFSPRNPKSAYSQANKERMKWLLQRGMIHPSMQDTAKKILNEEFVFPPDIIETIKSDELAWENYSKFSDEYKRIRIAYIDAARKRPDEFEKRLHNFIRKTRENKRIGFGGIEKYY
ncbi:YdeI family protein [Methanomethylovorans sp.]|uniref:YdeI/OmpD-associated family protein n=1 Tax=Methanomethylovorans sp. TaxID=2758717 RepID=UPI00351C320B